MGLNGVAVTGPLLDRLERLAVRARRDARRAVVGVAGPPGAGKTSLVEAVLAAAAGRAALTGRIAHVPMDGFHLTDAELDRLGRRGRKGAPDTFDPGAYAALLAAVRAPGRAAVTAPGFDHVVGEPVPGAVVVPPEAEVVLTEGNYLLLPSGGWQHVRPLLDEVWFCTLPDDLRRTRLTGRHRAAGRSPEDAAAWTAQTDEPNARLVAPGEGLADLVLTDGRVTGSAGAPRSGRPGR